MFFTSSSSSSPTSPTSPSDDFPNLTGPHAVGSIDIEIPVAELHDPCAAPLEDDIATIQYRIFYPCVRPEAREQRVEYWVPHPQRRYVAALAAFMGVGRWAGEILSFLPRNLYSIRLPTFASAPLLPPSSTDGTYPVFVFSHGLWGTRNTYSYFLSSLASHGVVVVAPEHRDGSGCATYVRDVPPAAATEEEEEQAKGDEAATTSARSLGSWFARSSTAGGRAQTGKLIAYNSYPHDRTPEVERGRNNMLRIRLWELGLLHSSLHDLMDGTRRTNLANEKVDDAKVFAMFKDKIDVRTPGGITWGGHSFGACTMVQFVKSLYYSAEHRSAPEDFEALYLPKPDEPVTSQITPKTQLILLDMWCFPLTFSSTKWLNAKPLPCWSRGASGDLVASRGHGILAIASQQFHIWTEHLQTTKSVLSPEPGVKSARASGKEPDTTDEDTTGLSNGDSSKNSINAGHPSEHTLLPQVSRHSPSKPFFFYISASAHPSQSDWGVLFPWLSKKAFGGDESARVLRLNIAAAVEFLRLGGKSLVGGVRVDDVEKEDEDEQQSVNQGSEMSGKIGSDVRFNNGGRSSSPPNLLSVDSGIRGWNYIDIDD